MSDVGPLTSTSMPDHVVGPDIAGSIDTSSRGSSPHGKHAVDTVEVELPADVGSVPGDDGGEDIDTAPAPLNTQSEETPIPAEVSTNLDPSKLPTPKTKPSMSVKPPTAKSNSGPPTPLVKRIINSGTFGTGSAKNVPVATKPAVSANPTTGKPSTTAPPLKKSTSSSSATSKNMVAPSRATTTAPNQRLSLASSKASTPPIVKPSLSASASAKPAPSVNATRASVVSPAGSATSSASRPRASISESVRKAPLSSRPSISAGIKPPVTTSTKPPPARSSASIATKPARTTTSISSIQEVGEDSKALEELQAKLKDTTESLISKNQDISRLEDSIEALNSSLRDALADVGSKRSLAEDLGREKSLLEQQLKEAADNLRNLEVEHQNASTMLEVLRQDLEVAKNAALSKNEVVEKLQKQVESLESEAISTRETLNTLQASTSAEVSASVTEREAFSKTQAELAALINTTEALKLTHASALQAAETKLKELEEKAALVDDLNAQIAHLKLEREENSGKLSELEVEILELKESQEVSEDERERSLAKIKSLEQQLAEAAAAIQQAQEDLQLKETQYVTQVNTTNNSHNEALQAASSEQAKITAVLEDVRTELANSLSALEQSKVDASATVEQYNQKLQQAEQAYVQKQGELMQEIKRITVELEGQENQFNLKVNAVKEQHQELLQEAFKRAKNEAAEEHAQELKTLRATSDSTMGQIQAMNQTTLDDLKAEHAATLDSEVSRLEKQINTLKLDLKATQDDLTKAKAALDTAHTNIESLTAQRDQARAAADSVPEISPAHAEEVSRLARELSNSKDDLAATTGALELANASLAEMSNKQTKELEEAAKSRADEVTKLRAAHDEEMASLMSQNSSLLVELSDTQGELATLKAAANSEAIVTKSNGNGAVQPPSPGVTKEELQRLHEAHNLKIYDLQAEHEKGLKALKDELEAAKLKTGELVQEVDRKTLEIQYLELDQQDNQEQITRLKEDMNSLSEQLSKAEAASA